MTGSQPVQNADEASDEQTKVFLSYSRKDREAVDRLATALEQRGHIDVLRDTEDILPTEEWKSRLEQLIGEADTVVFCLSPSSATSEVCGWEVQVALRLNKRIAPVVIKDVDGKVPEALAKLNYIFFTAGTDFDRALDNLLKALGTDIEWIREHTRLGELSRRWEINGKPEDRLLRGADVAAAEEWLGRRPGTAPLPTDSTRGFIEASRKGAVAHARRTRQIKAVVGVLLLAALVGVIYALWSNESLLTKQARLWADTWWPTVLKPLAEQALKPGDSFQECADCPRMVVIGAGDYMMGSPPDDGVDSERPQHHVTIGKAFAVSKFEITFDEWDACMAHGGCTHRADDHGWGRGLLPVTDVSWDDAQEYLKWLSRQTNKPYRLLSEAEWEYAARAGSTTTYPWGDDIGGGHANCPDCDSQWADKQPSPVGSFPANAFGLYDMIGNLWEWVQDNWHPNYDGAPQDGSVWLGGDESQRVTRGGSWGATAGEPTSAYRDFARPPAFRNYIFGIRVARELAQ